MTLAKDSCVDASGFETCQNAVTKKTSACVGQAKKDGNGTELLACGCQDAVDNFNCLAAHCCNQVWGCQYQEYMIQYFRSCAIAKQPVPYFPAPNNAPAACSCNLGKVYSVCLCRRHPVGGAVRNQADLGRRQRQRAGHPGLQLLPSQRSLFEMRSHGSCYLEQRRE